MHNNIVKTICDSCKVNDGNTIRQSKHCLEVSKYQWFGDVNLATKFWKKIELKTGLSGSIGRVAVHYYYSSILEPYRTLQNLTLSHRKTICR